MILGFVFQISALHFGPWPGLQPILALELLFVFAYMAVTAGGRWSGATWLAAVAMSAGGLFRLASRARRWRWPCHRPGAMTLSHSPARRGRRTGAAPTPPAGHEGAQPPPTGRKGPSTRCPGQA